MFIFSEHNCLCGGGGGFPVVSLSLSLFLEQGFARSKKVSETFDRERDFLPS